MFIDWLSPPFGYSLFYLRVWRRLKFRWQRFSAAENFMALQWLGAGLCIRVPGIAVWLPSPLYTH